MPPALRPIIGKQSLVKSLGTGNRAKPNRLAVPYNTEFATKLAEAASERFEYNGVWGHPNTSRRSNVKQRRHYNSSDLKSATQEWFTPPRVFEAMGMEFDMDVASPGAGIVPWIPAKRHLTLTEDSLKTPWQEFVWLNPPYGLRNGMQAWLDKFVAHGNGVILLPG